MATNNKLLNCPPLRFPEFNDEWQRTTLGRIAEIMKGSGISKDQLSPQGHPCILYGELYTKYLSEVIREIKSHTEIDPSSLILSQAGDVIIPSSGETAIDIAVARCVPVDNVALGGDLNIIRSSTTDGRFLAYQLNGAKKKEIAEFAQGVAVIHLYGRDLSKLKISLPSLSEQEKIASFLSLLDERIEAQRQTIKERKNQKKALLSQIFSQSLRFPEFSDKWTQTTLGEVVDIQRGERITKSDLVENGVYPVVSGGKEPMGYLNKYNQDGFTTTIAQYGTAGYIQWQRKPFWANDVCYILKPNSSYLIPVYLYNLISEKQLDIYRLVNTTAVPAHLPKERLLSLTIPLPSLPEQRKIAELLAIFDERIEAEEALLKCYEAQKRYLLRQMFV